MLKGLFKLPLRALEGFINSLFQLMAVTLQSPDYSCISKRTKTVDIQYRLPSQGPVAHLVIDASGLKVYGEGEWKIHKHGKEKRRVWRNLHLAVDATTHAVIADEVSLETGADNEVLPTLLNPLRCKIEQVNADEGQEQTRRAWYVCSPSSELSAPDWLGNGYPAADLINKAAITLENRFASSTLKLQVAYLTNHQ